MEIKILSEKVLRSIGWERETPFPGDLSNLRIVNKGRNQTKDFISVLLKKDDVVDLPEWVAEDLVARGFAETV